MHWRLKVVGDGGEEPHVLKTRYNPLLPVDISNFQDEYIYPLRRSIYAHDPCSLRLNVELEFQDVRTAAE